MNRDELEISELRKVIELHEAKDEGVKVRIADLEERYDAAMTEVASVLMLMDGLAEQWGDEGVFRRCRDRLRKLVEDARKA